MINDVDRPRLSNPFVVDEGNGIAFRIERGDGETLDLACTFDDVSDIFYFLGALAKAAGDEREPESLQPSQTYNDLTPIPAQGIGFQPGPGADETMIVMRLSGFDVAFAVPNSGLVALADEISRVARTLSADQGKRQ